MAFGRIMFTAAVAASLVGAQRIAAEPAFTACSLRAAAAGACDEAALSRWQDPALPAPASTTTTKRRDSLKNGAIIGGAIGLALGIIGSGIADCPGDDPSGSCPAARIGGVVLSTAIWTGIGVGVDALVADRTNAVAPPGKPARARIRALPPRPSIAMTLRW